MWQWAPEYYTQTQLTNAAKSKIATGAKELSDRIPHHFTRLAIMGPKPLKRGEMIYDMSSHTLGQIKHIGEQAISMRVWSHTYENLIYKTNKYQGVTHRNASRALTGTDPKDRATILGPSETRAINPSKWKLGGKPLSKITCKGWAKLLQNKLSKPARTKINKIQNGWTRLAGINMDMAMIAKLKKRCTRLPILPQEKMVYFKLLYRSLRVGSRCWGCDRVCPECTELETLEHTLLLCTTPSKHVS